MVPPRRTISIARLKHAEPVDAGVLHHLLGDRVGHQAGERVRELAARRAVRLHADRVDHGVRAAAVGQLAHRLGHVVDGRRRRSSARRGSRARARRSGTRSRPITCSTPSCCAIRHAISPIGPSPITRPAAALRDLRVLDRLPGGGQDVGEEQEAIVRRALGDLDRPVLRLRHAQELRLAARHLPVELGVAEQRGAHALVADLRRLALRLQAVLAHPAVPAGDVERDHHAVADREVRRRRRRPPRRRPSARARARRPRAGTAPAPRRDAGPSRTARSR